MKRMDCRKATEKAVEVPRYGQQNYRCPKALRQRRKKS